MLLIQFVSQKKFKIVEVIDHMWWEKSGGSMSVNCVTIHSQTPIDYEI